MSDILLLLTGAVLVNHQLLKQQVTQQSAQQLTPLPGAHLSSTLATALCTTIVMTLSSICAHAVYHYVLQPTGFPFLRLLAYVLVCAAVAKAVELALQEINSELAANTSVPLVTVNCVVLSVAAINDNRSTTFVEAVALGFGTAAVFSMTLLLFSALCARLNMADVPAPFRGSAISLVTIAVVSLAFMGFAGLV